MKKILATLLMMPVIVFSQGKTEPVKNHEVFCMSVTDLGELLKNFEEVPFVRGVSYREEGKEQVLSTLVVFVNTQNKSWTIVERTPEKMYCVIAVGRELEPVPQEITDDLKKQWQKSKS